MRRLLIYIVLVFTCSLSVAAQNGTFVPFDHPNSSATDTEPGGINRSGEIAGNYFANGVPLRQGDFVRLANGSFFSIGFPGAHETGLFGINDNGDLAGYYDVINPEQKWHGFKRVNGAITSVDFPGATHTYAFGINNSGVVVGRYVDSTGVHGFKLSGGTYTTIDYSGSSNTEAYGINDNGDVVGVGYESQTGNRRGFLLSGGTFIDISFNGASTSALGINNAGVIVGIVGIGGNQGFMRLSNGTYKAINFPGALKTRVTGINNLGNMSGSFVDANGIHGFKLTLEEPKPVIFIPGILGSILEDGNGKNLWPFDFPNLPSAKTIVATNVFGRTEDTKGLPGSYASLLKMLVDNGYREYKGFASKVGLCVDL